MIDGCENCGCDGEGDTFIQNAGNHLHDVTILRTPHKARFHRHENLKSHSGTILYSRLRDRQFKVREKGSAVIRTAQHVRRLQHSSTLNFSNDNSNARVVWGQWHLRGGGGRLDSDVITKDSPPTVTTATKLPTIIKANAVYIHIDMSSRKSLCCCV
jgi:hypothetical protein